MRHLFAKAESPFVASSPVYVVAYGEFPRVHGVDAEVLARLSNAPRAVRSFEAANLQQGSKEVIDAGTGKSAVLFFVQPYVTLQYDKAFAIGGTYANAMSLQRYIFELRRENGQWRIWSYARWGGEGFAPRTAAMPTRASRAVALRRNAGC